MIPSTTRRVRFSVGNGKHFYLPAELVAFHSGLVRDTLRFQPEPSTDYMTSSSLGALGDADHASSKGEKERGIAIVRQNNKKRTGGGLDPAAILNGEEDPFEYDTEDEADDAAMMEEELSSGHVIDIPLSRESGHKDNAVVSLLVQWLVQHSGGSTFAEEKEDSLMKEEIGFLNATLVDSSTSLAPIRARLLLPSSSSSSSAPPCADANVPSKQEDETREGGGEERELSSRSKVSLSCLMARRAVVAIEDPKTMNGDDDVRIVVEKLAQEAFGTSSEKAATTTTEATVLLLAQASSSAVRTLSVSSLNDAHFFCSSSLSSSAPQNNDFTRVPTSNHPTNDKGGLCQGVAPPELFFSESTICGDDDDVNNGGYVDGKKSKAKMRAEENLRVTRYALHPYITPPPPPPKSAGGEGKVGGNGNEEAAREDSWAGDVWVGGGGDAPPEKVDIGTAFKGGVLALGAKKKATDNNNNSNTANKTNNDKNCISPSGVFPGCETLVDFFSAITDNKSRRTIINNAGSGFNKSQKGPASWEAVEFLFHGLLFGEEEKELTIVSRQVKPISEKNKTTDNAGNKEATDGLMGVTVNTHRARPMTAHRSPSLLRNTVDKKRQREEAVKLAHFVLPAAFLCSSEPQSTSDPTAMQYNRVVLEKEQKEEKGDGEEDKKETKEGEEESSWLSDSKAATTLCADDGPQHLTPAIIKRFHRRLYFLSSLALALNIPRLHSLLTLVTASLVHAAHCVETELISTRKRRVEPTPPAASGSLLSQQRLPFRFNDPKILDERQMLLAKRQQGQQIGAAAEAGTPSSQRPSSSSASSAIRALSPTRVKPSYLSASAVEHAQFKRLSLVVSGLVGGEGDASDVHGGGSKDAIHLTEEEKAAKELREKGTAVEYTLGTLKVLPSPDTIRVVMASTQSDRPQAPNPNRGDGFLTVHSKTVTGGGHDNTKASSSQQQPPTFYNPSRLASQYQMSHSPHHTRQPFKPITSENSSGPAAIESAAVNTRDTIVFRERFNQTINAAERQKIVRSWLVGCDDDDNNNNAQAEEREENKKMRQRHGWFSAAEKEAIAERFQHNTNDSTFPLKDSDRADDCAMMDDDDGVVFDDGPSSGRSWHSEDVIY